MAIEGQRTMSKTQHYRKVTKPLLERKRRARMNHYLDELKELIVDTMEAQGEHVTKLEKADILELTVTYLKSKKQHHQGNPAKPLNAEKFREGYTQAAYEVSRIFASVPDIDLKFGSRVMKHLGHQMKDIEPSLSHHSSELKRMPPQSPDPNRPYHYHEKEDHHEGTSTDVWRPW